MGEQPTTEEHVPDTISNYFGEAEEDGKRQPALLFVSKLIRGF